MNWKLVRLVDRYLGIPLACFFLAARGLLFSPRRGPAAGQHKRILLVKFWGIGNLAMALPAARAIKIKYPEVSLDILTLFMNREAAEAANLFDAIHTVASDNAAVFIYQTLKSMLRLRLRAYDVTIDFEQFARYSALLCFLLGAPKRVGYSTQGQYRSRLYTHPFEYNNDLHIMQSFYSLADFGLSLPPRAPAVMAWRLDPQGAKQILAAGQASPDEVLVLMHAGTSINFIERRWPEENFAALADRLIEKYRVRVIFTGKGAEARIARRAHQAMKSPQRVVEAGSGLSFSEYISLVALSDLVISADTAAVHLASSLGIPVVGLYGPNTPQLYGPWSDKSMFFYKRFSCSPCITNYNAKINTCRHPQGRGACMRAISVDEVFTAIAQNYFSRNGPCRLRKLFSYESHIASGKEYLSQ